MVVKIWLIYRASSENRACKVDLGKLGPEWHDGLKPLIRA